MEVHRRCRPLLAIGAGGIALAVGLSAAGAEIGKPVPVAVTDGSARFVVPKPGPTSKTLVIVSALAREPGPFPIRLIVRGANQASPIRLADDGPTSRPNLGPPDLETLPEPTPRQPPLERAFHLLDRDGDVTSPGNYATIRARLRGLGRRVQVYVEEGDVARLGDDVVRDIVSTFDDRVHPLAARRFGTARDIDGDGRFTVLVSGRLAGLAVDGFVRGADFDPSMPAPLSNRCDLLYLNADLHPGPHLRTVLAHEYTHAVIASRKPLGPDGRAEEEGWLDEAIAHLVEDEHGFSRSNLDHRVNAFLSAPERYRLVVEDYYDAELFRAHGNRGSTYLFLRHCSSEFGPALVPALIGSPRRGVTNLEAATGRSFEALFRGWSVALFLESLKPNRDAAASGPRPTWLERGAGLGVECWSAVGTSPRYFLADGLVEVEVVGPDRAELQVTAVPLPDDWPKLQLAIEPTTAGFRARVSQTNGQPIRLTTLAWEPLIPPANPRESIPRRGQLADRTLDEALGGSNLSAGVARRSTLITWPSGGPPDRPTVFKLSGIDGTGRAIATWAEVGPIGSAPPQAGR